MAKYLIKPGAGAWKGPDGVLYGGGSVVTVADDYEPNILWEPKDEAAQKAHAAQVEKKAEVAAKNKADGQALSAVAHGLLPKPAEEAEVDPPPPPASELPPEVPTK